MSSILIRNELNKLHHKYLLEYFPFFFFLSSNSMFNQHKTNAYVLLAIVATNCILLTFAYPQNEVYQRRLQYRQQQQQQLQQQQISPVYAGGQENVARKYAVKPNASKKVALDDVEDDIEANQIQEAPNGFSWSNMLGTVLTMFFNGAANSPTKSDDVDGGFAGSPWANVISMGISLLNTFMFSNSYLFLFLNFRFENHKRFIGWWCSQRWHR